MIFYDELEVRDPAQREEMLFNGLVTQLKEAQKTRTLFQDTHRKYRCIVD